MISLPPELSPYRALLALFSPDIAASLGALLAPVARVIGPLKAHAHAQGGEPDGFSGVARRGSYERLLLSEWLLAEEAPDEFARRASMNELAFLDVARRSPTAPLVSVALFDAGPAQLGTPRIAHVAALVVLAQRAERAGGRFLWGVLHDPAGALVVGVTRESVLKLLGARSAVGASEDDIAAWAERAAAGQWNDVWIVGPSAEDFSPARGQARVSAGASAGAPWAPAFLTIHDVIDPGRRAVRVTGSSPLSPPRAIELSLPPPRSSARLLRDPFSVTVAAPRPLPGVAPTSNLIFAPSAHKLFARGAEGEIIAYPVPNSPRDQAGKPRRYRVATSGVVAAVCWAARGLATLTVTERELILDHANKNAPKSLRAAIRRPEHPPFAVPSVTDPLRPLFVLPYGPRFIALALDADAALFELSDDFEPPLRRLAAQVSAITSRGQHVAFIGRDHGEDDAPVPSTLRGRGEFAPGAVPSLGGGYYQVRLDGDTLGGTVWSLGGDGTFRAFFGFAEGGPPDRLLTAVQHQGAAGWRLLSGTERPVDLHAPEGAEVVGVWQESEKRAPELVLLDEQRRALMLHGEQGARVLPLASAPIAHVTLSTTRPYLAYATERGEVVVLSLLHPETPLARFVPEAG